MITDHDFIETVRSIRRGTSRLEREGEYWTEEEKEKLIRLFESSVGLTEIAVLLQRTERAVNQQIEKLDLYNEENSIVRRRKSEKPPKCLCERCQIGRSACPLWQGFQSSREEP